MLWQAPAPQKPDSSSSSSSSWHAQPPVQSNSHSNVIVALRHKCTGASQEHPSPSPVDHTTLPFRPSPCWTFHNRAFITAHSHPLSTPFVHLPYTHSHTTQGGIYHGRILLPAEYPFKPPAFMMLTPNGRFQTGTKICLSISSHHPEHWQPSWSVRTALTALIAFMPTPGQGAIGSLVSQLSQCH